jgi:hypothetical protein
MATLEQLTAALIKADAAGNAADAKELADEIRRVRAAPTAPELPTRFSLAFALKVAYRPPSRPDNWPTGVSSRPSLCCPAWLKLVVQLVVV